MDKENVVYILLELYLYLCGNISIYKEWNVIL